MASSLFPTYKPAFPNSLWFDCHISSTIPSDSELQKEEDQYNAMLKKEVNTKIVAIGQTKETVEQNGGEEEDVEEDEESNEDIDEETDEFDTASPELDSMEDDIDMINDTSAMNETAEAW